ncbi:stability/partitioning determinant [Aureimonas psammosilenae]|uniref:stability/partitioning determinant n=1 Tax=Aureimonas psammosilenae TaxID=2495496 RepID=UPI0012609644|nr:stability/partitioning determinant [Aureimonas psammosilenae]
MAGQERASLGFGDELDNFDPAEFTPAKQVVKPRPAPSKEAAEAAGFRSREPANAKKAAEPKKEQRRHRTGRNVQFNLKAKPETIAAFTAIADAQGWVLGEALEHATELLQREYKR